MNNLHDTCEKDPDGFCVNHAITPERVVAGSDNQSVFESTSFTVALTAPAPVCSATPDAPGVGPWIFLLLAAAVATGFFAANIWKGE